MTALTSDAILVGFELKSLEALQQMRLRPLLKPSAAVGIYRKHKIWEVILGFMILISEQLA